MQALHAGRGWPDESLQDKRMDKPGVTFPYGYS